MPFSYSISDDVKALGFEISLLRIDQICNAFLKKYPQVAKRKIFVSFEMDKVDDEKTSLDDGTRVLAGMTDYTQFEPTEAVKSIGVFSSITLFFRPGDKLNYLRIANSLWHELCHVNQVVTGRLAFDGPTVLWKNEPKGTVSELNTNIPFEVYENHPWEKEARTAGQNGWLWYDSQLQRDKWWSKFGIFYSIYQLFETLVYMHIRRTR